jgi:hypothetical protein
MFRKATWPVGLGKPDASTMSRKCPDTVGKFISAIESRGKPLRRMPQLAQVPASRPLAGMRQQDRNYEGTTGSSTKLMRLGSWKTRWVAFA